MVSGTRRPLGATLVEYGLVSQPDVDRALEYQQTHGGYFGEALVALGLVQQDEVDWALANQLDLAYVFPTPESVDPAVAALVSESWALSNLAVPIVLADETLTVAVVDPLQGDVVADLGARTGYSIELALASPERVRELIRALYGVQHSPADRGGTLHSLASLVEEALEAESARFGVSVRGTSATGWYEEDGVARPVPLNRGWRQTLRELFLPDPADAMEPGRQRAAEWQGLLRWAGALWVVRVCALPGAGGAEYLFEPVAGPGPGAPRRLSLPAAVTHELARLAERSGARVGVTGPESLLDAVLPHLPRLVLGERTRSAHLIADGAAQHAVYTIDLDRAGDILDRLLDYRLQAVSVDLPPGDARLGAALDAAPLAFLGLREGAQPPDLGLDHLLAIDPSDDAPEPCTLTALKP